MPDTFPGDAMLRAVAVGELIEERFPDTAEKPQQPERNTITGCLTGYGVEQATAALIRDDSIGAIIIREQVKIYAAWQDDPTQTTTAGTDACYELLTKALIVHGAANTNQDADRVLHKLVQAHRNGVRL